MKKWIEPRIEIVLLDASAEDILTTSRLPGDDLDEEEENAMLGDI